MSEPTAKNPPDGGGLIPHSVASRDLIGIVLSVAGAYGSVVFFGPVWMIAAGISGVGAILIFTSDATNSTNTAGYCFVLVSWSLLALNGLTTHVAIPTLITGFWFGFKTERQIWAERIRS